MPETKGGLVPGQIINLNNNKKLNFMFNPKEYTISKSNSWKTRPVKGKNVPRVRFQHGEAIQLKLQLTFDTYEDGTDVRKHTDVLWKMMMVDESKKSSDSDKAEPPKVRFKWGPFSFKAVIKSLSQKFTLFKEDGTPLRTTVDITLQQVQDTHDFPSQPGGGRATQSTVVQPQQGQRLDNVAADQTGNAGNYRAVADANNIDNPKKQPSGPLTIPSN